MAETTLSLFSGQRPKPRLDVETPPYRWIEIVYPVGRAQQDAVKLLHSHQQLIDLSDFPRMMSVLATAQERISLIDQ
jgi:hypothetical protein